MESIKYLDQVMKKHDLKNDSALARHLEISKGAVSMYRRGDRFMNNRTCLKIAIDLGIEPTEIFKTVEKDECEKTGQRSLWEVFMQKAAKTASTVAMSALIPFNVNYFLTPQDLMPKESTPYEHVINNNINYAKLI